MKRKKKVCKDCPSIEMEKRIKEFEKALEHKWKGTHK